MGERTLAFKVDENLPEEAAVAFRQAGYQVSTARSQGLAGAEDAQLGEVARAEGRVLVTLDVDFGDIRAYPPEEHPGIVVLRLAKQDRERILAAIERALASSGHGGRGGATVGRG